MPLSNMGLNEEPPRALRWRPLSWQCAVSSSGPFGPFFFSLEYVSRERGLGDEAAGGELQAAGKAKLFTIYQLPSTAACGRLT